MLVKVCFKCLSNIHSSKNTLKTSQGMSTSNNEILWSGQYKNLLRFKTVSTYQIRLGIRTKVSTYQTVLWYLIKFPFPSPCNGKNSPCRFYIECPNFRKNVVIIVLNLNEVWHSIVCVFSQILKIFTNSIFHSKTLFICIALFYTKIEIHLSFQAIKNIQVISTNTNV